MTDNNKDSDVTNDTNQPQGEVDVPGFRFDVAKDIPVSSAVVSTVESVGKALEGDRAELHKIQGSLAELGLTGVAIAMDPLNFLISAGLGFLIDVIQPLEDLIGLVTGNAERMEGEIAKWERVGNALEPLSEEIRTATNEGLVSWLGDAADAAKKRFGDFADGIAGVAEDVKLVTGVMELAKMVAEVLHAFIVEILALLIEWLILTWIAALAAAPATAGASTAAAGAATTVQVTVTVSRGVRMMDAVAKVFMRIIKVLRRVLPRCMKRMDEAFKNADGSVKPFKEILTGYWKDPVTYAGPAAKVTSTFGANAENSKDHDTSEHNYTNEEQEKNLDLTR